MTRTLYLMRHASAESHGPGGDVNRPLSTHGRSEAQWVGEQLRDAGIQQVLVSPAARTRQTVTALGLGVDTESEPRLYQAGSETILELIRGLDPALECALVVAHNPGIAALAHDLTGPGSDPAAAALIATHFPAATCCGYRVDSPWDELEQAQLVRVIRTGPGRELP